MRRYCGIVSLKLDDIQIPVKTSLTWKKKPQTTRGLFHELTHERNISCYPEDDSETLRLRWAISI